MNVRRAPARDVDPREYLDGANAAFGRWGDAAMFTWAFRDDAEILFLDDGERRATAGTGITWRLLSDGRHAAIMTGSWTLPEARGRGAFSQLFQATREIASERDAVLLAFVRADNASARVLAAGGAEMHPTFYCRSTVASSVAEELDALDADPSLFTTLGMTRVTFVYTPDQWRAQFLLRPNARIECVGRRGEWAAVVESTADFDRVHALSDDAFLPQLATRAHACGRRLFWFATRRPILECEWTDGFLASLPGVTTGWDLQNGDRM